MVIISNIQSIHSPLGLILIFSTISMERQFNEKYALYNSQSNYLKNLMNLSDHIVLLLTDLQIEMIEKSLSNYFYGNLNQFKF